MEEKIEDELRAKEEGVALIWRGRSVSPTSKKLELTQPLSLFQQARLEDNDVMQQLKVKRSTAAGSIQISSNACGSSLSSNVNGIGRLGE